MNRTGKITTGLLILLTIVWTCLKVIQWEALPPSRTIIIFTICIFIPIAIGLIFKRIFRNSKNPGKLQWIPNFINILWILLMSILIQGAIDNMNNIPESVKRDREQIKIEKSVSAWITNNSQYPESYQSVEFSDYIETIECVNKKDCYNLISDYIKSDYNAIAKVRYAYYFIKHKHLLKNKSEKLDTVTTYFQLSPYMEITNVRTPAEYKSSFLTKTSYEWRNLYGNSNQNLELEANGNTSKNYTFRLFDETGNFEGLIPYSNGKINGVFYRMRENGNLGAVISFKNGIRNGITLEICNNKIISFKGMTINGGFYGLSTWWHCNGQKSEEGIRVNDKKVGIWKYWDERGILKETKDFGNLKLLGSLETK